MNRKEDKIDIDEQKEKERTEMIKIIDETIEKFRLLKIENDNLQFRIAVIISDLKSHKKFTEKD